MKGYVDIYLLPVPTKELQAYRRVAQEFGRIAIEHGALADREFCGDDLKHGPGMLSFATPVSARRGETVVASVVEFKSRAHRDKVVRNMMKDERMKKLVDAGASFDMKRMYYGGFKTFVKA